MRYTDSLSYFTTDKLWCMAIFTGWRSQPAVQWIWRIFLWTGKSVR